MGGHRQGPKTTSLSRPTSTPTPPAPRQLGYSGSLRRAGGHGVSSQTSPTLRRARASHTRSQTHVVTDVLGLSEAHPPPSRCSS